MLALVLKKLFPGREVTTRAGSLEVSAPDDGCAQHVDLTFQELREITNDFSEERKLGQGPYGVVYKGVNKDDGHRIAVMLLDAFMPGLDNDLLQNEVHKLSMLKHPNLVQYISYCYETTHIQEESNGTSSSFVENTSRALCFEYLRNGSLEKHLSDEFAGLDWHTRFKIIKGTCEGLKYIHVEQEESIYHFNLKPDSILLDENMEPKLAYFGLSKIIGKNIRTIVGDNYRTLKYFPPEYIERNTLSTEFDVFSLGVIMIEIMAGPMGYVKKDDMVRKDFFHQASWNWYRRLRATWRHSALSTYYRQVQTCIQIALDCVEDDMHKRPKIVDIIKRLNMAKKYTVSPRVNLVSSHYVWEPPIDKGFTSRKVNIYVELNLLERIIDGREKPSKLHLPLLQHITKNFSDERKIGCGGCGVVYMGTLPDGIIVAVKKLFNSYTIEDKMFGQEVNSMMMINHPNTVRFLGYCSHTEEKAIEMEGKFIMAEIRERLLCFEYIRNGSLENQLTDELRGLEWHMRYQIIRGICEGMHHLHKEKHIIHMDLKPSNILLDDQMVPKITDFGLSRFDEKSKTMSAERLVSPGYCAPEYMHDGKISAKSDIYSLGVIIIELVTGSKEIPSINKVLRRWKHRWSKSAKDTHLGYKQVAKCVDLALSCKHTDPKDRPDIEDILSGLNEMDSSSVHINDTTECLELEDMLGTEPLEMHFPLELNEKISRFVELINDTDDYFAFRISTTSLRPYNIEPNKDIVPPRSKCVVTITLEALENVPPLNQGKDEFSVRSTRVDGSLTATDITGDLFSEHLNKVVDDVNLVVVLDMPQLPGDW